MLRQLGKLYNAGFQEFYASVAMPEGRAIQQTNTRRIDHYPVARESATVRGPNM